MGQFLMATALSRCKIQVYEYRATAFDGVRTFDGVASGGSRVCSVVACSGPAVDTCSVRFSEYSPQSTHLFERLSIAATVPTPLPVTELSSADAAYFPTSLDTAILPLPPHGYSYEEAADGARTVYRFTLLQRDAELLSFGVWGRLFRTDGSEPTPPLEIAPPPPADGSAAVARLSWGSILVYVIWSYFKIANWLHL